VRIGALDQIALQVQLQKQFRQKLIRIFGEEWKSGEYAFSKGVSQPDPATEMDLDIGSIIMEGIRCNYSLDRLRSYMEKKDRMNLPLARAERYPYNINRLSLTDQEHGLLKQLDGSRNMRELATASDQKEDQIIRAAYAFLVLGMASFADAEGKTAARPKKKKAKKPLPKPKAAAAAPAAKAAEPKAAGPKMDMPLLDKKPVGFSQKESESLKKISELIRNKEYDDAETEIEEFLKSVKSGVVRSEALTTLAQLFYHRATSYGIKRFFRAKELLLEAVAEKPPCEQAFVYLGRIFREQKNYYEALRHLERGKELYPQSFEMQQEIKLVRMYVELR